MFYEAISYDKINIKRGGEGAAVTRNLRYHEGARTHAHTHTHRRIAILAVLQVVFTFMLRGLTHGNHGLQIYVSATPVTGVKESISFPAHAEAPKSS